MSTCFSVIYRVLGSQYHVVILQQIRFLGKVVGLVVLMHAIAIVCGVNESANFAANLTLYSEIINVRVL